MSNASDIARGRFEQGLLGLLLQHGAAADPPLAARVHDAVNNMLDALAASSLDGTSLTPLEVVRIRANKLAAASLPAAVFRDRARLAALRAELHVLARAWLAALP